MNYCSRCNFKWFQLIIAWALIQSCSPLPQSEFYEIDGIVSISSDQLTYNEGWSTINRNSTVSVISTPDSTGYVEPLSFPFYIQSPGLYSLWILGNQIGSSSEVTNVSLSLLDDQGEQLYQTIINKDSASIMRWNNRDFDDQSIAFQIHRPGHYRVNFRPIGLDGVIINKVHLTLDNENPPQGVGLPATSDPRLDPLLQKREQRVDLPPSWILGPVYGGYADYTKMNLSEELLERFGIEDGELRNWDQSPNYGQFEISDLRENIELMANPAFITYEIPYASYDVGGFYYNENPPFEEELIIRWAQFATFNSVMHLFSREVYESLVESGELSEESYSHVKDLTLLRSRLFPYLYSEYHLTRGTRVKPVCGNSDFPTQYMFGDSFLAAPMYSVGEDERFVNLPSGIWYDYFDGTRYDGGQSWLVEAPLNKIPLFVKAGSIIPYRDEKRSAYPAFSDSLLIEVYGGSVGTFRLYEDDGISTQYKQGQFSTTAFRYFERDDYSTFTIGRVSREFSGQPSEKVLTLIFKYVQKPTSVLANKEELSEGSGMSEWYYDEGEGRLILNWIQQNSIKTDFEFIF